MSRNPEVKSQKLKTNLTRDSPRKIYELVSAPYRPPNILFMSKDPAVKLLIEIEENLPRTENEAYI